MDLLFNELYQCLTKEAYHGKTYIWQGDYTKKTTNGEEILVQNTNFEIPFTSFLG